MEKVGWWKTIPESPDRQKLSTLKLSSNPHHSNHHAHTTSCPSTLQGAAQAHVDKWGYERPAFQ